MSGPLSAAKEDQLKPIDPKEIRAAVAAIAQCPAFVASKQLSAFLNYVVEKSLSGEADRIKAYSIATEALGRSDRFDPSSDPIVRVEAGRLRRALAAYYDGEGAPALIRIVIPRGSYVPRFERRAVSPEGAKTRPARARRMLWPLWLLVGLLVVAVVIATAPRWLELAGLRPRDDSPMMPVAALKPTVPRVFIGPFKIADGAMIAGLTADGFSSKVATAMARFDNVTVVAKPEGEADYTVSGTLEEGPTDVVASVLLVHRISGRVVWSSRFEAPRDPIQPVVPLDGLVRNITVEIVQPYGILMADRLARTSEDDDGFACIIHSFDYWRSFDDSHHVASRTCLEDLTRRYPNYALSFAQLAFLYVDEARFGFDPRPGKAALVRALQSAMMAVQLAPTSARAHQALSYAYFASGHFDRAIDAAQKAVDLNPFDTDIAADFGRILIVEGRYQQGLDLIDASAKANAAYPGWYDLYRALAAFQMSDTAAMRRYLARTDLKAHPLAPILRLIAANRAGMSDETDAILSDIRTRFPDLVAHPAETLSRLVPSQDLVDRLVDSAHLAGL